MVFNYTGHRKTMSTSYLLKRSGKPFMKKIVNKNNYLQSFYNQQEEILDEKRSLIANIRSEEKIRKSNINLYLKETAKENKNTVVKNLELIRNQIEEANREKTPSQKDLIIYLQNKLKKQETEILKQKPLSGFFQENALIIDDHSENLSKKEKPKTLMINLSKMLANQTINLLNFLNEINMFSQQTENSENQCEELSKQVFKKYKTNLVQNEKNSLILLIPKVFNYSDSNAHEINSQEYLSNFGLFKLDPNNLVEHLKKEFENQPKKEISLVDLKNAMMKISVCVDNQKQQEIYMVRYQQALKRQARLEAEKEKQRMLIKIENEKRFKRNYERLMKIFAENDAKAEKIKEKHKWIDFKNQQKKLELQARKVHTARSEKREIIEQPELPKERKRKRKYSEGNLIYTDIDLVHEILYDLISKIPKIYKKMRFENKNRPLSQITKKNKPILNKYKSQIINEPKIGKTVSTPQKNDRKPVLDAQVQSEIKNEEILENEYLSPENHIQNNAEEILLNIPKNQISSEFIENNENLITQNAENTPIKQDLQISENVNENQQNSPNSVKSMRKPNEELILAPMKNDRIFTESEEKNNNNLSPKYVQQFVGDGLEAIEEKIESSPETIKEKIINENLSKNIQDKQEIKKFEEISEQIHEEIISENNLEIEENKEKSSLKKKKKHKKGKKKLQKSERQAEKSEKQAEKSEKIQKLEKHEKIVKSKKTEKQKKSVKATENLNENKQENEEILENNLQEEEKEEIKKNPKKIVKKVKTTRAKKSNRKQEENQRNQENNNNEIISQPTNTNSPNFSNENFTTPSQATHILSFPTSIEKIIVTERKSDENDENSTERKIRCQSELQDLAENGEKSEDSKRDLNKSNSPNLSSTSLNVDAIVKTTRRNFLERALRRSVTSMKTAEKLMLLTENSIVEEIPENQAPGEADSKKNLGKAFQASGFAPIPEDKKQEKEPSRKPSDVLKFKVEYNDLEIQEQIQEVLAEQQKLNAKSLENTPADKEPKAPQFRADILMKAMQLAQINSANKGSIKKSARQIIKNEDGAKTINNADIIKNHLANNESPKFVKSISEEEEKWLTDYMEMLNKKQAEIEKKKQEELDKIEQEKERKKAEEEQESSFDSNDEIDLYEQMSNIDKMHKRMKDPKRMELLMDALKKNDEIKNLLLQQNAHENNIENCNSTLKGFFNEEKFPNFHNAKLGNSKFTPIVDLNNLTSIGQDMDDNMHKWGWETTKSTNSPRQIAEKSPLYKEKIICHDPYGKMNSEQLNLLLKQSHSDYEAVLREALKLPLPPDEKLSLAKAHANFALQELKERKREIEKMHNDSIQSPTFRKISARNLVIHLKDKEIQEIKALKEKIKSGPKKYKVKMKVLENRSKMSENEILERRYNLLNS